MHDTSKRLYEAAAALRDARDPSSVARLIGASPQTLKNWESRGVSNQGMLDAEREIGCRAAWIRTGEGPMTVGEAFPIDENVTQYLPKGYRRVVEYDPDDDNYIEIRKVKLKLSAGITGFAVEPEIDHGRPIVFRKEWFRKNGYFPEKLIALGVKGESMEPTMSDGDTVVVNTGDIALKDGETYAINYDGEDIIKRLVKDYGRWFLVSDNPDQKRYHRQECTGATCIVVGRVIVLQRESF